MKKLIFILLIGLLFTFNANSQEIVYKGQTQVATNYDLSGISGSTYAVKIYVVDAPEFTWHIEAWWSSITGIGSVAIYVSDDGATWYKYYTSPSEVISSSTSKLLLEDKYLSWRYVALLITKGTLSAGLFNAKIKIL